MVRTNSEGEYEIDLPEESIVFISNPANYGVPVSEDNLPRFFYTHYPMGTPKVAEWAWDVIAPTGPLPDSIDFPLLPPPAEPTANINAMAFADPQAKREEEQDMGREDVVYDTLSLYERHNRMFAQIGIPIWNVPGNHDMNYRSSNHKYATQTFVSVFGPTYYSFDYGQIHVVALNNVQYKGDGNGKYDNKIYRGYIP